MLTNLASRFLKAAGTHIAIYLSPSCQIDQLPGEIADWWCVCSIVLWICSFAPGHCIYICPWRKWCNGNLPNNQAMDWTHVGLLAILQGAFPMQVHMYYGLLLLLPSVVRRFVSTECLCWRHSKPPPHCCNHTPHASYQILKKKSRQAIPQLQADDL